MSHVRRALVDYVFYVNIRRGTYQNIVCTQGVEDKRYTQIEEEVPEGKG